MAITSTLTTSFKKQLLEGTHNFKNSGGNNFKLALYTSSATLGATTTAFTTTGQASGTNYTSSGANLTNVDPTSSGTTGFTDFADLTFGTATITARGCMIYNSSATNASVATIDFGSPAFDSFRCVSYLSISIGFCSTSFCSTWLLSKTLNCFLDREQ
jgi:hypothetical protein